MRVRAGLVTAIYTKALVLSNDERTRASGDIVNLMSVDATRLQDLCTYGLIAISGPLQVSSSASSNMFFFFLIRAFRLLLPSFRFTIYSGGQLLSAWLSCFFLSHWTQVSIVFLVHTNRRLICVVVIARILKRMQEEQMKNRDKRTRLMSELLANIKR